MEMPVAVTSRDENTDPNWIGKVFLWQEQALFVGQASDTSLHASPAIKICVAIDGEIKLRTSENESWKSFQAAIIAPGQIHAIEIIYEYAESQKQRHAPPSVRHG